MTVERFIERAFPAPLNDEDIARLSCSLRQEHGENAYGMAVKRAEDLLALGDVPGCTAWIKIAAAIEELNQRP